MGAAEGDINLYVSVRQHALNGFISRYIVSCRSFDRKSFDLRSPLSIDDCYRAIDNGADDLWILAPVAPPSTYKNGQSLRVWFSYRHAIGHSFA